MIVRFVWQRRSAEHFLLRNVTVVFEADGVSVPTVVELGSAYADVRDTTLVLRCTLTFSVPRGANAVEVLRIDQQLQRSEGYYGFQPISYLVESGAHRRHIPGIHPLLRGWGQLFVVRTALVDVTALVPRFGELLGKVAPRAAGGTFASSPRIFARTDGMLPQIWIVATPYRCRGAEVTDVLCYLGPSQNHPDAPPLEEQIRGARDKDVVKYGLVMLGGGTHSIPPGELEHILWDHFRPGDGFILARGFEKSLVVSGKHAIIAIPLPANLSHNAAATSALPGLLADVHRLVIAVGDAHPPLSPGDPTRCDKEVNLEPRLALAAHSRGGLALWGEGPGRPGALSAASGTYSDLMLFEALKVTANLHKLERSGASVVFAGYDPNTVSGPFGAAAMIPSLAPRIRRIPVAPAGGAAPESASLADLASRSPSLTHALTADPHLVWPIDPTSLFLLKHQLAVWSGDMVGLSSAPEVPFLVQALNGSGLR